MNMSRKYAVFSRLHRSWPTADNWGDMESPLFFMPSFQDLRCARSRRQFEFPQYVWYINRVHMVPRRYARCYEQHVISCRMRCMSPRGN
jgi:hypothetical protein